MKKLSVKMKITLWYTGLIVIILSAIFTAVLLATDKVLLLGVQNKLEEEVYDFAEELKVDSNGRLRLEKLDFLKDGVRLAVYHENGQMITGLVASGLPETPFADELLQKAGSDQQNWFVYDFYFKPRHADNFYWVRGTVPLSSAYAERDKILRQCALFFPLLVLLAALGGYWITKKAFRPVTRITEAARRSAAAVICPKGSNWKALMMRSIRWRKPLTGCLPDLRMLLKPSDSLPTMLPTNCEHRPR